MKKQPNTHKVDKTRQKAGLKTYRERLEIGDSPQRAAMYAIKAASYSSLPGKDSVMYREVNEYPIALITPDNHRYKQWINDFGINGQEYVMVNSIDCIRGRYFSAIQPGLLSWEVDADIVDHASDRVRPFTPPETKPVSVSDKQTASEKYGFRVPYDGSNNFYDEEAIKHFEAGWDAAKLSTTQPTKVDEAQERYKKGVLSLNERATNTGEFGYIVVCELMKIAAGLNQ